VGHNNTVWNLLWQQTIERSEFMMFSFWWPLTSFTPYSGCGTAGNKNRHSLVEVNHSDGQILSITMPFVTYTVHLGDLKYN
jgi:hypothetical protein